MDKQREYALNKLIKIDRDKSFSSEVLRDLNRQFNEQEAGFVRRLVYGTIQNRIYMDHIIKKLSKVKFRNIHISIKNILRMSLFQLNYMDHIPSSAVVNEAVLLAKKHGHGGSVGFVNGVLREFTRNPEKYTDLSELGEVERLATQYSFPIYLVEMWMDEIETDIEELLTFMNSEAEFAIRVNTTLSARDMLKGELISQGYDVVYSKLAEDGLVIESPTGILNTKAFKNGKFYVQSESSMKVADIAYSEDIKTVIDLCAAPGGKSTHMAQKMNDSGTVHSLDIYEKKLQLIKENAKRLKLKSIKVGINDATVFNEKYRDLADVVIIDAPCSGFGLIRKKPEIKLFKTEEDIEEIISIQRNILDASVEYVKTGGHLIYSTCTMNKSENEENIEWFLENNPNFQLIPIENQRYVNYIPNIAHTDGFFIAKLMKIS